MIARFIDEDRSLPIISIIRHAGIRASSKDVSYRKHGSVLTPLLAVVIGIPSQLKVKQDNARAVNEMKSGFNKILKAGCRQSDK